MNQSDCTFFQSLLLEGPHGDDPVGMGAHLKSCQGCQSFQKGMQNVDRALLALPRGLITLTALEGHEDLLFSEETDNLFEKLNHREPLTPDEEGILKGQFNGQPAGICCEVVQQMLLDASCGIACPDDAKQEMDMHVAQCERCASFKQAAQAFDEQLDLVPKGFIALTASMGREEELLLKQKKERRTLMKPGHLARAAAILLIVLMVFYHLVMPRLPWFSGSLPGEIASLLQQLESKDTQRAFKATLKLSAYSTQPVIEALAQGMHQSQNAELRGGCMLALLRIGSDTAVDHVKKWNYSTALARASFRRVWTDCTDQEREAIFDALWEHSVSRHVLYFISDAASMGERGIIPFCMRVFRHSNVLDEKTRALSALEELQDAGDLNLHEEFNAFLEKRDSLKQDDITLFLWLTKVATAVQYRATNHDLFDIFGAFPDMGIRHPHRTIFHGCTFYFLKTLPPSQWSGEEYRKMWDIYENATGLKKVQVAKVLALDKNPGPIAFLAEKIRQGNKWERWSILGTLCNIKIPNMLPFIKALLISTPPHFEPIDIEMLHRILGIHD